MLARLMDGTSLLALWFCGGGGEASEKGQWHLPTYLSRRKLSPSSHLDARHYIFSLYATGAFQAATLVLELRESEFEQVRVWVL